MFKAILTTLLFSLMLQKNIAAPPTLTGKWVGLMGEEMLEINVLARKNKICGYTYDYTLSDKSNYCKALFEARYNAEQKVWYLNGSGFLENSGGHVLMSLRLWFEPGEGKNTLHGLVSTKSGFLSFLGSVDEVTLERVSSVPDNLMAIEAACFPPEIKPPVETRKPTPPPATKPLPSIPREPIEDSTSNNIIPKPMPAPAVPLPPKEIKRDNAISKITNRKKNAFAHLVVDVKNITLNVYDNGVVDGDTVSIYYNGKLLASRQRISEKPITLQLELDENAVSHEILLYAENLGSIPPNTALVVVIAGSKRYELHSSSSLTENAVLILEYKPK
ncbi:MAG: hypothetical protein ABIW38_09355 [Ferruginibacter sp.]